MKETKDEEFEEQPESEVLAYSPVKKLEGNPPLLSPRTWFDSSDGSYWTSVRVATGL